MPVAALLLSYIRIGANVVNSKGDIPTEFITVIQGIVILLVAAEEFMGGFKKKMIYKAQRKVWPRTRRKKWKRSCPRTAARERSSNMFTLDWFANFGISVFRLSTPLIFAALAAVINRKAGMLNMALEGYDALPPLWAAWPAPASPEASGSDF